MFKLTTWTLAAVTSLALVGGCTTTTDPAPTEVVTKTTTTSAAEHPGTIVQQAQPRPWNGADVHVTAKAPAAPQVHQQVAVTVPTKPVAKPVAPPVEHAVIKPVHPKAPPPVAARPAPAKSADQGVANPQDRDLLDSLISRQQHCAALAEQAGSAAPTPDLQALARRIGDSQKKDMQALQSLRDQWYINQPVAADKSLLETANASGDILGSLKSDLQETLSLARDAQQSAGHPELKKLAQQIVAADQQQLALVDRASAAAPTTPAP